MKGKNHVERELLLKYAMSDVHTFAEQDQGRLGIEDTRYVERHLKECAACRRQFDLMKGAVETGDRLLTKIVESHFEQPAVKVVRPAFSFKKFRIPVAPSLAGAFALVVISIVLPRWINPPYAPLATVVDELGEQLPEPRKASALNDGAAHFNQGNYAEAIESFRRSIRLENEIENHGLAQLYLGLTFLKIAENRQLVLFYSFDRELADSALTHLNASMEINGEFPIMQNIALYFSAKAHLMRNDASAATKALKACADMDLEKSQAAKELLKQISLPH